MVKVLNFGSLNLDYVYKVEHNVKSGETITASSLETFFGGKGLNQSVALANSGVRVFHAGKVGYDGDGLIDILKKYNVNTDYIVKDDIQSGQAIIQVDRNGENSIVLFGGANLKVTKQEVDNVLKEFCKDDIILLQNEISNVDYIIKKAREIGMVIFLNLAPINENILKLPLKSIDYLILNETETVALSGENDIEKAIFKLQQEYANLKLVITLGKDGVVFCDGENKIRQDIFKVEVKDTTAAGDTFIGYFINGIVNNKEISEILKISCKASALCVSRLGASNSIPFMEDVTLISINKFE